MLPLRRMTLLNAGSLYCSANNLGAISIGSQNSPQYPDGDGHYMDSLEELIKKDLDNEVFSIEKPFFNLSKKEIIEKYNQKDLLEKYVFSCVMPKDGKKCGNCYKCNDLRYTISQLRKVVL